MRRSVGLRLIFTRDERRRYSATTRGGDAFGDANSDSIVNSNSTRRRTNQSINQSIVRSFVRSFSYFFFDDGDPCLDADDDFLVIGDGGASSCAPCNSRTISFISSLSKKLRLS